jgi:hypothetical protein
VKEAIIAAFVAARAHSHALAPAEAANLSDAWDCALFTAFDAARPPGKLESWTRKSFPKIAACFQAARLETTSPERSDEVHLSAVAIFESQWRELHAQQR